MQKFIVSQNYIHIFTSPKIALFKKFKANVLDHLRFTSRLNLLAMNKIYFIQEWGNTFWSPYSKIEKVQKRVPTHVFLLGLSGTLTKNMRFCILYKAGFWDDYWLI